MIIFRKILIFSTLLLFFNSCVTEKKVVGRYDLESFVSHETINLYANKTFKYIIVGNYCTDTFRGEWKKRLKTVKYEILEHTYSSCGKKPEFEVKYYNSSTGEKEIHVLHQNKPYPWPRVTLNDNKSSYKLDTTGTLALDNKTEIEKLKFTNCAGFYEGFEFKPKKNNFDIILVNITSDYYHFTFNYIPEKSRWRYSNNSLKLIKLFNSNDQIYEKSSSAPSEVAAEEEDLFVY